jgi:thioredoxin-related protein
MKRYLLLVLLLSQVIYATTLKTIYAFSDLPKEKNIVLMFSMDFCPYCKRQERSIIKKIQPKFPDIAYLQVKKGTKIFEELMSTGNFGEVEYYPTTFIMIVDKDGSIFVKYPFKGEQRSSLIINILENKEIMEE